MATAFQQSAFQDNAWQIEDSGDEAVIPAVIPGGVKRRFRKYEKDENLEKLFPHLRELEKDRNEWKREKKRQLYAQTTPSVALVEFPPLPGRAYVPLRYELEIKLDPNLDAVARLSEEEELIEMLGVID